MVLFCFTISRKCHTLYKDFTLSNMKNFLIPNKKNNYKPYLLRIIALVSYSILLILVNSFGGVLGIQQAQASTISPENIISLTNQQRGASGLNSLNNNSKLAAAALAKANDMFEKQYWDHFGPNGETPWQCIRAAGYNYVYAGENLAKGFRTAEGVHEAWMASPTHKANIMSANYQDIGVAVVEGVLNGQQTTLVVQMFGNLTADIAGVVEKPVSQPTEPKVSTGNAEVTVGKEQGEIKSIKINSPENSSLIADPNVDIKGEVTNITGQYTVEIFDESESVGQTTSDAKTWEFNKESDWSEGDHNVIASVKADNVKSDPVSFEIDSTPPIIQKDTLTVSKNENNFIISLELEGEWKDIALISGDINQTLNYEDLKDNKIEITIPIKSIGSKSVLLTSDVLGNMTELDITEYFPMEKEDQTNTKSLSIIKTDLGDQISIGIVAFIFILLCVEIFVYIKKGKLSQVKGELFTLGTWWMILAIAVFNGFTGIIN